MMETIENILNKIAAGKIEDAWEGIMKANWLMNGIQYITDHFLCFVLCIPLLLPLAKLIKYIYKQIKDYL